MAQVKELSDDPIYPIRLSADSNHDPNDHPNVVVRQTANL
jgi:hypothetical protein